MKECSKCLETKNETEFYIRSKKKGTLNVWCKVCMKQYDKMRYQNFDPQKRIVKNARQKINREKLQKIAWDYLMAHPCVDCGESDPVVLEFDHRENKLWEIAQLTKDGTPKKFAEEILKCDVRCANCHRRKTAKDFGWYKYKIGLLAEID